MMPSEMEPSAPRQLLPTAGNLMGLLLLLNRKRQHQAMPSD